MISQLLCLKAKKQKPRNIINGSKQKRLKTLRVAPYQNKIYREERASYCSMTCTQHLKNGKRPEAPFMYQGVAIDIPGYTVQLHPHP